MENSEQMSARLRRFASRDEFLDSTESICDAFFGTDAVLILKKPSLAIKLISEIPSEGESRILVAQPEEGGLVAGWLVLAEHVRDAAKVLSEAAAEVIFIKWDVPVQVRELGASLGYSAEIEHQENGYWIHESEELPEAPPSYPPTGAILRAKDKPSDTEEICALDLVAINWKWTTLSSACLLTREHSTWIGDGEGACVRFVTFPSPGCRCIYTVYGGFEVIEPPEVFERFGEKAHASMVSGHREADAMVLKLSMEIRLSREQTEILDHAVNRAVGGYYCGDSPDMRVLVMAGMMKSVGRKSFVPDEYFCITEKGRSALRLVEPAIR